MRLKLAIVGAVVAATSLASPALAAGGNPGTAGAVPPAPGLSLVSKLGASSIAVNTGQPVVDITLITNNAPSSELVTLDYQVSTDALSPSCQMPGWSAAPVLVSPGSTAGVATKAVSPGCSAAYTMSVTATAASGASASTQVAWSQFLKLRNGG